MKFSLNVFRTPITTSTSRVDDSEIRHTLIHKMDKSPWRNFHAVLQVSPLVFQIEDGDCPHSAKRNLKTDYIMNAPNTSPSFWGPFTYPPNNIHIYCLSNKNIEKIWLRPEPIKIRLNHVTVFNSLGMLKSCTTFERGFSFLSSAELAAMGNYCYSYSDHEFNDSTFNKGFHVNK